VAAEIQTKKSLVGKYFPSGRVAGLYPLFGLMLVLALVGQVYSLFNFRLGDFPIDEYLIVAVWTVLSLAFGEYRVKGLWGATFLVATWLSRAWALPQINFHLYAGGSIFVAIIVAQVVPRAALIALAWVTRPGVAGPAKELAATLTTSSALSAIALGLVSIALGGYYCGWLYAITILLLTYIAVQLMRLWFNRLAHGVTADGLGLLRQVLEVAFLWLLTVRLPSGFQWF